MSFAQLNHLRKRLGFRLVFWYALFLFSTALVVGLISYHYVSYSLRDNRRVIQSKLSQLTELGEQGDVEKIRTLAESQRVRSRKSAIFIRVLNAHREALFVSEPKFWDEFDLEAFDRHALHEGWQYVGSKRDHDVLEMISVRFKNGLWLQVGKTVEDRREILAHYRETIIGVTVGMTVLGLVGGAFLAFRALRPIRRLTQAMQAIITTGQVSARVPESGAGDDLDELTAVFNRMLERIESLIAKMREALDNVAHDMRTPLARIRGEAEVALHNESGVEQLRDALASNIEESERTLALLNSLMDISEAESGSMRLQIEAVALRGLIEEVVDLYQYSAEDAQVSVTVSAEDKVTLMADRTRLRQVLANLLDNAIKYSRPGGTIVIEIVQNGERTLISFKDDGMGIGPEEISKVWDRLYRGDKSRSQPGLGLGLSIVRAVVRAHGGEVDVSSTPGAGSIFSISFLRRLVTT